MPLRVRHSFLHYIRSGAHATTAAEWTWFHRGLGNDVTFPRRAARFPRIRESESRARLVYRGEYIADPPIRTQSSGGARRVRKRIIVIVDWTVNALIIAPSQVIATACRSLSRRVRKSGAKKIVRLVNSRDNVTLHRVNVTLHTRVLHTFVRRGINGKSDQRESRV